MYRYLLRRKMCSIFKFQIIRSECAYSEKVYDKFNEIERKKILNVLNETPIESLASYNLTKATLKRLAQWKGDKGKVETLSDVEYIEGLTQRSTKKLFDGILKGPIEKKTVNKIKGQVLQPALDETLRKNCKTIVTVYIAVNSVTWLCINRENYEIIDWKYEHLDFPDTKKMQITDIFNLSWRIVNSLPIADIYVTKPEATTLRAAGSDPNNPKVISVNLQKSQMVAMMVALINARCNDINSETKEMLSDHVSTPVKQKVFFLRPTLPYRLYGTLVGNEKVSTDQVVEMLLQESNAKSTDNTKFSISDELKSRFRNSNDLQQDMLGHCLLLGLTFMDICVYRNEEKIQRLINRGE